jgi:glycosyltransferase involved in cell wall biosynthesis
MIRVLIDSDAFENTHQHGVRRWLTHVWREIAPAASVTMVQGNRLRVPPLGITIDAPPRWMLALPSDLRALLLARSQRTRFARGARDHDIFMATYFSPGPHGERLLPVICTLYDMIVERFPGEFDDRFAKEEALRKRGGMEAADAIVCISHATAGDLASIYPHLTEKAVVIHPGADHVQLPGPSDGNPLASRYVAHIGGRKGYKNGSLLVDAVADAEWPSGVLLALIGPPLTPDEHDRIERRGIAQKVVSIENPSDDAMRRLAGRASGIVSPSLCEGFGFPVVEGHVYGVPVACADTPIYREVAGNAAEFFANNDARACARAVASMLEEPRRSALIRAGISNAARFTWKQTGANHLELFERVLRESRSKSDRSG